MNALESTSTRPYLIRALYEWCTDNGFTPYVAVFVDASVQVPTEYVKNNEIVLNVGFEATSGLKLGMEFSMDQVDLTQVGLGRVTRHPRTMLDRLAQMGIALDP